MKLKLEDQIEMFNFITTLDQRNLMYSETNIPVGQIFIKGKCLNGDNEMPIDLITVKYANRVASSQQKKISDH